MTGIGLLGSVVAGRSPSFDERARPLLELTLQSFFGDRMDAVELLVKQHRLLEAQLESLVTAGGVEARQASLSEVGDHLGVHLASEEEVFYPAVRAQRTEDDLLESLEEHSR